MQRALDGEFGVYVRHQNTLGRIHHGANARGFSFSAFAAVLQVLLFDSICLEFSSGFGLDGCLGSTDFSIFGRLHSSGSFGGRRHSSCSGSVDFNLVREDP